LRLASLRLKTENAKAAVEAARPMTKVGSKGSGKGVKASKSEKGNSSHPGRPRDLLERWLVFLRAAAVALAVVVAPAVVLVALVGWLSTSARPRMATGASRSYNQAVKIFERRPRRPFVSSCSRLEMVL
jgi:hypothetical protein